MPYTETHTITLGPITLPLGIEVDVAPAQPGQQQVTITGVTATGKADTVALLEEAFAILMTAASAEGVGEPVFGAATPAAPAPASSGTTA